MTKEYKFSAFDTLYFTKDNNRGGGDYGSYGDEFIPLTKQGLQGGKLVWEGRLCKGSEVTENVWVDENILTSTVIIPATKDENSVQEDQWDETLRGKKMSDTTGNVIFKYQMPVLESFEMKLPKGAKIIRVEDQGGMFWMWALVNTNAPDEMRKFYSFKCGGKIPEHLDVDKLVYVGFCKIYVQQELGLYIFEEPQND